MDKLYNQGPYEFGHAEGKPRYAAVGRWRVTGPNIETIYFQERTTAAVVARALNQAFFYGVKCWRDITQENK